MLWIADKVLDSGISLTGVVTAGEGVRHYIK